jgi:uncharacterized protein
VLQPSHPQAFRVTLDELREGGRRIDAALDTAWLDWALAGCEYPLASATGRLEMELEAVSEGVLVRGRVRIGVETECGICLACARLELEPEINCFLMPRSEGPEMEEEAELTPEDLEREWFSGDTIFLDDLVRDAIMLELPMTPRCAADCAVPDTGARGFLDVPGGFVDPRLAPLAGLLKNMKESD